MHDSTLDEDVLSSSAMHEVGDADRKTVSFVVAVYRNERAVTITHQKIRDLFQARLTSYDYRIVFVDDGSDDGSLPELIGIKEQDPKVTVISFTRNFGQMAAMMAGFREAKGDAVINISADLQDPIELVETMIDQWEKGSQLVVCHRTARADTFAARLQSKVAYRILRMSTPNMPAGGFDYCLMDRALMDDFLSIPARNRYFQGDLLWLSGYRTIFLPYERLERTIGKSQYRFWKKMKNFLDAVLDASYLPIRFISLCGVLTAFSGFAYGLSVIGAWLAGTTPFEGWAALTMILLVVGGMIMLMLGIIGEYVWRIFDEVRGKPLYVIRKKY